MTTTEVTAPNTTNTLPPCGCLNCAAERAFPSSDRAALRIGAAPVPVASAEVVLLKNGRYARVTHKLTTAAGRKLVRVHYLKGTPATVEADSVAAVWTLMWGSSVMAVPAAAAQPSDEQGVS